MKNLKLSLFPVLIATLLITTACAGVIPLSPDANAQAPTATTQPAERPTQAPATPIPNPTSTPQAAAASGGEVVLLFGIGMHIEPFGSLPSSLVGGAPKTPPPQAAPGDKRRPNYNDLKFFERSSQDILAVAGIVEAHGGKLTVQAQTPFTQVDISSGSAILADLAQSGHEMALHFHEDAHLGKNSEALDVETWCTVMQEEIALVEQASGVSQIRFWSGGNLYPGLFQAAACAGLDVNSDWKNPETQSTPLELVGLHPWRPAGGTDGYDLSMITQHDPQGAVVFLPEGLYDRGDFASMRRSEETGGDQGYFEYLEQSLLNSLAAAQAGQVNVFHFTVHPGEFRGDPQHPFEVIERFLREVVDPLVASGQVRWATFSEMTDAFQAWEQTHPGANPR